MLTFGWMSIEAAVAIGAGIAAHSLTLIAFAVDSVVELASAGLLIWRLAVELRRGQAFCEHTERNASRIGGALLFAPAAYVVASAGWGLWTRRCLVDRRRDIARDRLVSRQGGARGVDWRELRMR